MEEAFETTNMESKDQTQIMKGRRTKRQRPQSPIPFSIAPSNSLYCDTVETSFDSKDIETSKNRNDSTDDYYTKGVSSSASSSNNNRVGMSAEDEEDQDMANCLILLAQGQSILKESKKDHMSEGNNNNNDIGTTAYKFTSRRFLETSSDGVNGKAGYYVYQCKTCDRTFPSFQALGGHRASHKKPKAMYADERKNHNPKKPYKEDGRFIKNHNSPVSLHLSNNNNNGDSNNSRGFMFGNVNNLGRGHMNNKVHECGICGAEFTSGQALGGHMRRHRGMVIGANTALSLSPVSLDQSDGQDHPAKKVRNSLSLDLDLNLPAPEDDHHNNSENGIRFVASKQEQAQENEQQEQQKRLVLSAPTLVNCHY